MNNEHALVGALIQKPEKLFEIEHILRPGDLTGNALVAVGIIKEMMAAGEYIDLVTVASKASGRIDPAWLAASTDIGFYSGAIGYAESVAKDGKVRRIKSRLSDIAKTTTTLGPDYSLEELLDLYSSEAGVVRNSSKAEEVVRRFDFVVQGNKERGGVLGVDTGYESFQRYMVEYVPSHCWVIGAQPGGGKTALVADMIARARRSNIILFSTEASEEQIVARYISNRTGIDSRIVLSGRLAGGAADSVSKAADELSASNIRIYDNVYDLSEIQAEVRKARMRGKVDLVLIDFVQNCTTRGVSDEYASQTLMAKSLQSLMKEVRACGVFFSQLPNDFIENISKGGLRFKGSGAWYQIADLGALIMVHSTDPARRKFDARKHRHGPQFSFELSFTNNYTRFDEK